ncbi:hypothetical protein DFH94DRAFT_2547 [Russula ochroleuca]|uniref:DUF6534 domain-containing protein n=1 Tax=Russula ochroleuca TaxID=152965 RepID=A0A9P5TDX6_9AGAM|nr:hypothetical protein DFH94DRAFT_2547 [Russula ochroleuca]
MEHSVHPLPFDLPSNIQELAAPQLLGALWNWFLYGALVVQFYVYIYNFPRDNKYIKLLVYGIFFLETVQTVLSGADLYYWFAAGFGNVDQLTSPFFSFLDVSIMGAVVSLCVQFFFVYRISILSEKRSRWLLVCLIICLLSITGALAAFAVGIFSHISDGFLEGKGLEIFEMTWIIANTLSDLLIASSMLYHLRRIWTNDGNLSSYILVSIVRLTVETNLVTTTASIAALLMVALYPDKNWYLCPTYVLGKLYSNTLLVSLNNRISIRDSYEALEGVVDRQAVTVPGSGRSEATKDATTLVAEKA